MFSHSINQWNNLGVYQTCRTTPLPFPDEKKETRVPHEGISTHHGKSCYFFYFRTKKKQFYDISK